MIRPSRLYLGLLVTLGLCWKLDTSSRWQEVLALTRPQGPLLSAAVPPLPALDSTKPARDTAAVVDPFGTLEPAVVQAVAKPASSSAPKPPRTIAPGSRPWKLMGLVGTRSAILANGEKTWVVGSGETVGNLRVVSIGAGGVTLEDEAGTWTLAPGR